MADLIMYKAISHKKSLANEEKEGSVEGAGEDEDEVEGADEDEGSDEGDDESTDEGEYECADEGDDEGDDERQGKVRQESRPPSWSRWLLPWAAPSAP